MGTNNNNSNDDNEGGSKKVAHITTAMIPTKNKNTEPSSTAKWKG